MDNKGSRQRSVLWSTRNYTGQVKKKYNAASHIWKYGLEAFGSYSHSSDRSKVEDSCHLNDIMGGGGWG